MGGGSRKLRCQRRRVLCKAGKGGVLYTKDAYDDFVVRLEFKLPPGGTTAWRFAIPATGTPPTWECANCRCSTPRTRSTPKLDPRQAHGSAYGMMPAHRGYLRPVGQWNYQQVTVQGSNIKVELNGVTILNGDLGKVTEFMANSPHPGKDRNRGIFGFAGHSDPVEFRNISIQRLKPAGT